MVELVRPGVPPWIPASLPPLSFLELTELNSFKTNLALAIAQIIKLGSFSIEVFELSSSWYTL